MSEIVLEEIGAIEVILAPDPVIDAFVHVIAVEEIAIGIPGPRGAPGIVRVNHGSDPDVLRPDAPIVLWVGSVQPNHRDEAVDLIALTP